MAKHCSERSRSPRVVAIGSRRRKRSCSTTSRRRPPSCCATCGWSKSCAPRVSASCGRRTKNDEGSSATCTTERSKGSLRCPCRWDAREQLRADRGPCRASCWLGRRASCALRSLADRSPVPVEIEVSLGRRPSEPAEAAAYFIVSEALANVVKHAQASVARVSVTRSDHYLLIDVSDDGVGGAEATAGGGLQGLEDRTAAIGGRLSIASSPGTGTRLRAEIPCD